MGLLLHREHNGFNYLSPYGAKSPISCLELELLPGERNVLSFQLPASPPQTSWWADFMAVAVIIITEQHLFESKVDFPRRCWVRHFCSG